MTIFSGNFIDLTVSFCLKKLFNSIGCSNLNYFNNLNFINDFRSSFLLNDTLFFLEDLNIFLFVGLNLRLESPLLNSKFRKLYLKNKFNFFFFSLGQSLNYLSYPLIHLGNSMNLLYNILIFRSIFLKDIILFDFLSFNFFFDFFFSFSKFSILFGSFFYKRFDSLNLYSSFNFFFSFTFFLYYNLFIISSFLGNISNLEVNFFNNNFDFFSNFTYLFYLYGLDDFFYLNNSSFFIYHGPFKNNNFILNFVNILLPSNIFTEDKFLFYNLEGRLRITEKAYNLNDYIISDSDLILSFFSVLDLKFFNNFSILFDFRFIMVFFYDLIFYDVLFSFSLVFLRKFLFFFSFIYLKSLNTFFFKLLILNHTLKFFNSLFFRVINNFYSSDYFCLNSKTLSLCSLKFLNKISSFSFSF